MNLLLIKRAQSYSSSIMSIFTSVVCIIITVLEGQLSPVKLTSFLFMSSTVRLAITLRRNWRAICDAGQDGSVDIQLITRVIAFGAYVFCRILSVFISSLPFLIFYMLMCDIRVASVWWQCGPRRVPCLIFTRSPVRLPHSLNRWFSNFLIFSWRGSDAHLRFSTSRLAILVLLAFQTSSSRDQCQPQPR